MAGVPKDIHRKDANTLCKKCLRSCRQPEAVLLLDCPRYCPMPFKIAEHRFSQMDLFGE